MKCWWESKIKVWFQFMNETARPRYFQNRIIMFCLPIFTFMYLFGSVRTEWGHLANPQLGCPRKWHFGIPRNTEVISGTIPRNFAEFRRNFAKITSEVKKFRGIPCRRNSVDTLPPASLAFLPSRASSHTRSNPALLAPQCRYEAIWVWLYTTFIVNEAVVNRKLAAET